MAKDDDQIREPDPTHILHTLTDEKGHKMAERLFQHYVRDESNRSRLPAFLIQLDRILNGMGGVPPDPEVDEDGNPIADAGDDEGGGPQDDGEDYADDEDLHASSAPAKETSSSAALDREAQNVRAAALRALGRR